MSEKVNIFDRVLKVMARDYPRQFVQLALPDSRLQIIGTLENVELALPEDRVDFVHRVLDGEEEKILHLEFQTKHEGDVPERMFEYSGLLTRLFKRQVVSVALYVKYRRKPLPNAYEVTVGGRVVNRFTYEAVPLWEYADDIAAGHWRELAPLLVMLRREPPDEGVLARERALILQEEDRRKRADLLACAVTMAARYFDKEFLCRYFREEVEMMREATFVGEWLEEKLEEGLQQGREQGLQEGLQQGLQQGLQRGLNQGLQEGALRQLVRVLEHRFGRMPLSVEMKLRPLSAEQLENLLDVALDVDSLDAFLRHLPDGC
jgi:predicted transposase YdaD